MRSNKKFLAGCCNHRWCDRAVPDVEMERCQRGRPYVRGKIRSMEAIPGGQDQTWAVRFAPL